ncbi:conserved hypothetical protein [Vibrio nigripulchritudo SFn27]|uniref:Uncharacterized protein n=1 Tax=Vibrio nigripulchritudo TaxID=28173 RepID=U4KHF4_9VIBR|nr:hypothetical protein [Vibrio nigripulchritudo]CCN85486.1 conserved hypothetical protein [Vibrio nigripulchritudo BLFn1]CCN89045.1 conserved hypothetical protein [Vibrio nigripulchritudo SFn27]CCN95455.1 conserved hypothetical protein [Vibrio nigripulchritudo ENn2]CCO43212.1 conserved hypothetical protein [Vibrio nigripulchritudo SFn135]CCO54502.1 conserved hypothetical protein [Vibrio nigripulchritudo Wn13]
MEKEILGYVVCRTCLTPKAIMQGTGKRANYVYGRCECGLDNRTGAAAQKKMRAYKTLEEVQAEIEQLKNPEPEPEPQPESKHVVNQPQPDSESKPMGTAAYVGIGAVTGFVLGGIFKVIKAVA